MQVLNARVPEDYNGISPNPLDIEAIGKQGVQFTTRQ
jgi:hypothetical protein